jgi:hypothetical protein
MTEHGELVQSVQSVHRNPVSTWEYEEINHFSDDNPARNDLIQTFNFIEASSAKRLATPLRYVFESRHHGMRYHIPKLQWLLGGLSRAGTA